MLPNFDLRQHTSSPLTKTLQLLKDAGVFRFGFFSEVTLRDCNDAKNFTLTLDTKVSRLKVVGKPKQWDSYRDKAKVHLVPKKCNVAIGLEALQETVVLTVRANERRSFLAVEAPTIQLTSCNLRQIDLDALDGDIIIQRNGQLTCGWFRAYAKGTIRFRSSKGTFGDIALTSDSEAVVDACLYIQRFFRKLGKQGLRLGTDGKLDFMEGGLLSISGSLINFGTITASTGALTVECSDVITDTSGKDTIHRGAEAIASVRQVRANANLVKRNLFAIEKVKPQELLGSIRQGAIVSHRLTRAVSHAKKIADPKHQADAALMDEIISWKRREHGCIVARHLVAKVPGSVDDGSQLQGLEFLELNVGGSVKLPQQWEWIAGNVFGKVGTNLLINGKLSWWEVGARNGDETFCLLAGRLEFTSRAEVSIYLGGKFVIAGEMVNASANVTWNGTLDFTAQRLIQKQSAGFLCHHSWLRITTRQGSNEVEGRFEIEKFIWQILSGETNCKASVQVGQMLKFNLDNLSELSLSGTVAVENGPLQGEGDGTLRISGKCTMLDALLAQSLILQIEKGANINIHPGNQKSLVHVASLDLFTKSGSQIICSGENLIFRGLIGRNLEHNGALSFDTTPAAILITVENNATIGPNAEIAPAATTCLIANEDFTLIDRAQLNGIAILEVSGNRVVFGRNSSLTCLSDKNSTLVVKAGSLLYNNGIVSADNVTIVATDLLDNSGIITATRGLTLGSTSVVINRGIIATLDCPLRILTAEFDNCNGHLLSRDNAIEIELYGNKKTAIAGKISTRQAIIVKAAHCSELEFVPTLPIDSRLIFVRSSPAGCTIVGTPIAIQKCDLRFLVGAKLVFQRNVEARSCDIGILGCDDHALDVVVEVQEEIVVEELNIASADIPNATIVIQGPGNIRATNVRIQGLRSLTIATRAEFGSVSCEDTTEILVAAGGNMQVREQLSSRCLKLLEIGECGKGTFGQALQIPTSRLSCSGTLQLSPSSGAACKSIYFDQKAELLVVAPADSVLPELTTEAQKDSVAIMIAKGIFGDAFVRECQKAYRSRHPDDEKMQNRKTSTPSITLAATDEVALVGEVNLKGNISLSLLCEGGNVAITGRLCVDNDVTICSREVTISSSLQMRTAQIKATKSIKLDGSSKITCSTGLVMEAGKFDKAKINVEKKTLDEDELAKLGGLKESAALFPRITISGKIESKSLDIKARLVIVDRGLVNIDYGPVKINAWFFINFFGKMRVANLDFRFQIVGVNIGAVFSWKSLTISCLSFINMAYIHAPMLVVNGIACLLLVGTTMAFSRNIKAALKLELFHAALPTIPTKELLLSPQHILNAALTTLQQCFPAYKAIFMAIQTGTMILTAFKNLLSIGCKVKDWISLSEKQSFELTDLISLVVEVMGAFTMFQNTANQCSKTYDSFKSKSDVDLPAEFADVDYGKVARDFIGNNFLPTMTETTIFSNNRGIRVGWSITDRGIYGTEGGTIITGGTYMADYSISFNGTGTVYSCGDVMITTKHLKTNAIIKARGDVTLKAEDIDAMNITSYQKFRALASGNIKVSNSQANNIIASSSDGNVSVSGSHANSGLSATGKTSASIDTSNAGSFLSATATDGEARVTSSSSGGTISSIGSTVSTVRDAKATAIYAEGAIVTGTNLQADSAILIGETNASLEGNMKIGSASVKADCVKIDELAEKVFGKLDIRAEKKLENLEAIVNRSKGYSNFKVTQSLSLDVPNQEVIFKLSQQMDHALIVNAKSIGVKEGVNVEATGDLVLVSNQTGIDITKNSAFKSTEGRVDLQAKVGDFVLREGASVQGKTAASITAEKGALSLAANSSATADGDIDLYAKQQISANLATVSSKQGDTFLRSESEGIKLVGSKVSSKGILSASAPDDVSITDSHLKGGRNTTIHSDKRVNVLSSEIASDGLTRVTGREGVTAAGQFKATGNGQLAYVRSEIKGGLGDAYDATVVDRQGIQSEERRNLAVFIGSEQGNVDLQGTGVSAVGDIAFNAENGRVDFKTQTWEKEIASNKDTGPFGLWSKKSSTTQTQFEQTKIATSQGMLIVNAKAGFKATGAVMLTKDGGRIATQGKAVFEDVVGNIVSKSSSKIAAGLIADHSVKETQEFSIGTQLIATNPNSSFIIQAENSIGMIGTSVVTPGLVVLDAPVVSLSDRTLNRERIEKHWGLYVQAPLASIVTDEKQFLAAHPLYQAVQPFEGQNDSNVKRFASAVNGILDTTNALADPDAMLRQYGVGTTQSLDPTVTIGVKFTSDVSKAQQLAGTGLIKAGALQVNAQNFAWENGAFLSADVATFNVRNFVIEGAQLHSSSQSSGFRLAGNIGAESGKFLGGQVSYDYADSSSTVYQNTQGSFGHVNLVNVDKLTGSDFNVATNSIAGEVKQATFKSSLSQLNSNSKHATMNSSLSATMGASKSNERKVAQQSSLLIGEGGSGNLHFGELNLQGATTLNANSQSMFSAEKVTASNVIESTEADSFSITAPGIADPAFHASIQTSTESGSGSARATIANLDGQPVVVRNREGQAVALNGVNTNLEDAHKEMEVKKEELSVGISLATVGRALVNMATSSPKTMPDIAEEKRQLVQDGDILSELVYELPKGGIDGMNDKLMEMGKTNEDAASLSERLSGFDPELSKAMPNGQAAVAFSESDRVVYVAFRGTQSFPDLLADVAIGAFGRAPRQAEANALIEATKEKYAGYEVRVVGHSLGGNIAMNAANDVKGIEAYASNAPDGAFGFATAAVHRNHAKPNESPITHKRRHLDIISRPSTFSDRMPDTTSYVIPPLEDHSSFADFVKNPKAFILENHLQERVINGDRSKSNDHNLSTIPEN